MGKLKTKKSVSKRFKITKNGYFKHKKSHLSHILTKKSQNRKRKLRKMKYISKSHTKSLKIALPNI